MQNERFKIYCDLAFGTTFDPKNQKRKKKRNKRKFEDIEKIEDDIQCKEEPCSVTVDCESDSSEESEPQPVKVREKKPKELSAMQLSKIRKEEITHFRRVHKIFVTGDDIPDPIEQFYQLVSDYEADPAILENVFLLGYETPTPIQMQAIPLMVHSRQILACAPTGSGKTAAFLIPLIHDLKEHASGGIRAVILAPTRELSNQIKSVCEQLSQGTGLCSLLIEKSTEVDKKVFKRHDILISTPNRLIYLLKSETPVLSLKSVEWLIVDECDKLFEAGNAERCFRTQLATIYNACQGAKRAFFSATYSHDVEQWCKMNIDSLVSVAIGIKNTAVETIKQELLFAGNEGGKLLAIRELFQKGFCPPVLVFVQSKERATELHSELAVVVRRCSLIHSGLDQSIRDRTVEEFVNGKVWVLICTELMGRGIDFKGVKTVINYDFPPTAISYIHRIGRTGRAGAEGRAITYFTSADVGNLKSIGHVMRNAGCEVPAYIMALKTKKRRKSDKVVAIPIKRPRISTVPKYELEKKFKKRKLIQDSIKKRKLKRKKEKTDKKASK